MGYGKDDEATAGVDAPVESENEGINPADLDIAFDDDEVDEAARERPVPTGRQRLRIADGTIKRSRETAGVPNRPYFNFRMELVDAPPGEEFDAIFEMVFFPWTDENGVRQRGRMQMKRLQAFERATGVKVSGRSAADVIAEAKGVEFDAKYKIKNDEFGKQARINEYC